jgi:hypothetical protein
MSELRTLETFVVNEVVGREIFSDIPGCPLSPEARRLLLADCPVFMLDSSDSDSGHEADAGRGDDLQLLQPSPNHNRSFAIIGPGFNELWQDEYGNQYNSFTLKGINFTSPGIFEHPVSADGVVAWGLQESKIIGRVLTASEVLYRRGVSTERIVGLAEPKEYPWPATDQQAATHEYLSLGQYKQRIVEDYWRQLPEAERSIEVLADLTKKFSDITFFISLRATDTAYRLSDIADASIAAKFFDEVNTHQLSSHDDELYDSSKWSDTGRYISHFFAPRAGKNLAKLHEDMAHGFANGLNWTALGGIVDLDSVHGESLGMGDDPVTNAERAADILSTLDAIKATAPRNYNNEDDSRNYARRAIENFLNSYFDETIARLGDIPEVVEYLGQLVVELGPSFNDLHDDGDLDDSIIKTACELYYNRFFYKKYPKQFVAAYGKMAPSIQEVIETDGSLAGTVQGTIRDNLHNYGRMIVEDYIGEMADPSYDVFARFIKDSPRTSAWTAICQDITEAIVIHCVQSHGVFANTPECIRGVENDDLRDLLLGIFLAAFRPAFQELADKIVPVSIPLIEDALRDCCAYKRPEPLLDGYTSELYVGLDAKRFWLAANDVPFKTVASYITAFDGELYSASLPKPTPSGELQLKIESGDGVVELITDGEVNSTMVDSHGNAPSIEVCVDAQNTTYILLVSKSPEGNTRLGLLMDTYKTA